MTYLVEGLDFLPSFSCQARVEHRRHKVLPVPVGDSSKAFVPALNAPIACDMNVSCTSYGFFGNVTGTPSRTRSCDSSLSLRPCSFRLLLLLVDMSDFSYVVGTLLREH